jgi:sugar lactone lactonase YvrE
MPDTTRARIRALCLLLAGATVVSVAAAGGPSFWTVATAADFLRGTSDGVSVSSLGTLTAGPALTNRLRVAPPQVWSVAEAPDGTIWGGTGGDGRVVRLRPGQAEETVFDADEPNIFAVAVAGNRVYAASSPDGRVYVIEGNAPAKPFFDPAEKYIWALTVDATGRLWVGAGSPATVYRVDQDGTSKVMYRPPAGHVVTLAKDADGRVLAGTESPGRLYRFGPDDRPFAMLDSGLTELRAVSAGPDGVIYAAALNRGDDTPSTDAATAAIVLATPPATPATPTPTPSSRRSQLYRIDANGSWESVWETTDLIYDVSAQDDGSVLVATGPSGRLYRVGKARDVLLVTGVDAKQITRFAGRTRAGSRVPAFATANPGRVLAPGAGDASAATYTSQVRDSKSIAAWGLLRWEATGPVTLFTRSGNTEIPDDSWSDWSGPYASRQGEAIKSPAARFIQWKTVIGRPADGTLAQLTSVTVAYLSRNTRPVVSAITIHPPGVVFQRPFSSEEGAIAGMDDLTADARRPPGDPGPPTPSPGRRMFQKGLQTLAWKADDADGDRLTYTLQYRGEGRDDVARSADRSVRSTVRLGHDVRRRRPLRYSRHGIRQSVQSHERGARRRSRQRRRGYRQYPATDHQHRGPIRHVRAAERARAGCAQSDSAARVFHWRRELAGGLSGRRPVGLSR